MKTTIQQQIITVITDEWKRYAGDDSLTGVWIREYPPLPPDADMVYHKSPPVAVWYLDGAGLAVRTLEEWSLFHAEWEAQWASAHSHPRRFAVGMAAMAPFQGGKQWYSETQWGPSWGRGWRWVIEEGRLNGRDQIWIS